MKPLIGVLPLWDAEKGCLRMLPDYLEALEQAGAVPVVLPLSSAEADLAQLCGVCHGLLFTGGPDLDPALYGEENLDGLSVVAPQRDVTELLALGLALERDMPILGICRGIQVLNVALGGTLWQDIPRQCPSELVHAQQPPYSAPSHTVRVLPGTPLAELVPGEVLPVNSCHHQAIRDLAPSLTLMARSDDGLAEAVWAPDRFFLWGVQWHPERMVEADETSRALFGRFVEACRAYSGSA